MIELRARPLTQVDYTPYGNVLGCDRDDVAGTSANMGTAVRKNFLVPLESLRPEARANLATFRCAPQTVWPFTITLLEKHPHSTQVFVPMNARRYVVIVAGGKDEPDLTTLRAFLVGTAVGISYHPGIWHHPMIALDQITDFVCLVWEDGTDEDAIVHPIATPVHVTLEP